MAELPGVSDMAFRRRASIARSSVRAATPLRDQSAIPTEGAFRLSRRRRDAALGVWKWAYVQ